MAETSWRGRNFHSENALDVRNKSGLQPTMEVSREWRIPLAERSIPANG